MASGAAAAVAAAAPLALAAAGAAAAVPADLLAAKNGGDGVRCLPLAVERLLVSRADASASAPLLCRLRLALGAVALVGAATAGAAAPSLGGATLEK